MNRLRMHLLCKSLFQLWRNHPVLIRDDVKGGFVLPSNGRDLGAEFVWTAHLSPGGCEQPLFRRREVLRKVFCYTFIRQPEEAVQIGANLLVL